MARQNEKNNARDLRSAKEDISYLRQKFNSLTMRGHYRECFKLIEDNLELLYFQERWPENFLSTLRLHKRCFASMDIGQGYDEYLTDLLRKKKIPALFVQFLKKNDASLTWTAEHFRGLAMQCKDNKDFVEALEYCELMIKSDPTNSGGYVLKGWILEDMELGNQAENAYQQAIELNETNYQAWKSLAGHYSGQSPKKALEYIDRAIEKAPSEPTLIATKAKILAKIGDREQAIEYYNQAIALDPLNAKYLYRKGEVLLEEGQTLAAMRMYTQAVSIDEKHAKSHWRLASLFAPDQPDKALYHATALVKLQPKNTDAMLFRASLLRRTGETLQATRQYKQILEVDPENAKAFGGLGELYLQGEPDRALDMYLRAAELDSQTPAYRLGVAQSYEYLYQKQQAVGEYKQVIEMDRRCSKAYGSLGLLLLEDLPAEAYGYLSTAVSLEPKNPYYLFGKGEAMVKTGKKGEQVLACFREAVEQDPGNAKIRLRLAQLLEEVGNYTSAIEHYRAAASLNTHSAPAHCGVARLIMDSDPYDALVYINKAIIQDPINGELYYIKALILRLLGRRGGIVEHIQTLRGGYQTENLDEMGHLVDGDAMNLALMYINRADQMDPGNAKYVCARADMLLEIGTAQKALQQYQKALELDPSMHQAMFGIASIQKEKRPEEALKQLDRAIAIAPDNPVYHAARGSVLAKFPESREEALRAFDRSIALDKHQWTVVLEKAELLDDMGRAVEAQAHYRRVLLSNPKCLEATARMGILLAERNTQAAINYMEQAILLDPETADHYMWKGLFLYMSGKDEEGEACCVQALELHGHTHDIYAKLAELLKDRVPAQALRYIDSAVFMEGGNWEYHLLRGDICTRLGRLGDTEESYKRVLELNGGCHDAMAKLARLYFVKKDAEKSLEYITKALSLCGDYGGYLYIQARILDELLEDTQGAIEAAEAAVKLEPDSVNYRTKLIELLEKSRQRVRLTLERGKLKRLQRRISKEEEAARIAAQQVEPPPELPKEEKKKDETAQAGAIELVEDPVEYTG